MKIPLSDHVPVQLTINDCHGKDVDDGDVSKIKVLTDLVFKMMSTWRKAEGTALSSLLEEEGREQDLRISLQEKGRCKQL